MCGVLPYTTFITSPSPMKVETTSNYAKFKTLMGNRFVNSSHVRKIAESLNKFNYLAYNPVLVNEEMYVIDGQHRIAAAEMLKIPVQFVIVPGASLDTVRSLNSSLKAWTVRDFCESYVKTGNEDYVTLLDFADTYGVQLTAAAALLAGNTKSISGGSIGRLLRDGRFRVQNLNNALTTIENLKRIELYTENGVWISRDFIRAFVIFCQKGGDIDKLVSQLERSPERKIRREADYRKYLLALQDIYNFNAHKRLEIL